MKARVAGLVAMAVGIGVAVVVALSPAGHAQSSAALGGRVTSAEEGPMEGVLVGAKRAGSTITVTVATDAGGRYSFPAGKLASQSELESCAARSRAGVNFRSAVDVSPALTSTLSGPSRS